MPFRPHPARKPKQRWHGLLACVALFPSCGSPAQPQHNPPPSMPAADRAALQSALAAYDEGRMQAAEPVLLAMARRYPKNFEANEALGSLYAEASDPTRALPYLQQACKDLPRSAVGHANLGVALSKLGRAGEAAAEFDAAARLDPRNADSQSGLGQALLASAHPAEAAKAFERASNLKPANPDFRYNWALALYESNDPRQAAAVLARTPEAAFTDQAHALAGDVDEKLGLYKEAIAHFQAAAQANPSDPNLYSLTLELLRHWTWPEALRIANFGAEQYPGSVHFKVAAGIALFGDNKYAPAASTFASLLAADPGNTLYADLLGRSCSALADDTQASCSGLEAFAQTHPTNGRAAAYAATSILHRPATPQDTARAEALLRQAIAADPSLAEALYQLAVIAQQRSAWQESADALRKAIALHPAYAEAHYRLSRAYAHLGERDKAQQEIALQQKFAEAEKNTLNARMQEVVTFLTKPN